METILGVLMSVATNQKWGSQDLYGGIGVYGAGLAFCFALFCFVSWIPFLYLRNFVVSAFNGFGRYETCLLGW
jgi:hypothetical protein